MRLAGKLGSSSATATSAALALASKPRKLLDATAASLLQRRGAWARTASFRASTVIMAMAGAARPITAFFAKRKAPSDDGEGANSKRAAADSSGAQGAAPAGPSPPALASSSTALSPEAQRRVEESRKKAVLIRAEKTGVPSAALVSASWARVLKTEFDKPYFTKLMAFLSQQKAKGKRIYPPAPEVFSWSDACSLEDVKVVILGQDPYHGPNEAHGLCFSVKKGVTVPPSLRNMYKELATDVPGFEPPRHGYLQSWASQGVLLLNACLTVEHKSPNSHKDQGWERFTDAVVSAVDRHCDSVVFVLWGSYAKKKGAKVNKKRHLVLEGVHPSPLSAHRGYFGCGHFSKANEWLAKKGRKPIDWTSVMNEK